MLSLSLFVQEEVIKEGLVSASFSTEHGEYWRCAALIYAASWRLARLQQVFSKQEPSDQWLGSLQSSNHDLPLKTLPAPSFLHPTWLLTGSLSLETAYKEPWAKYPTTLLTCPGAGEHPSCHPFLGMGGNQQISLLGGDLHSPFHVV